MYKNVLSNIPGIEYYPIVALVLFFGFFAALIIWFIKVDPKSLDPIAMQPLDDGTAVSDQSTATQSISRS